MFHRFSFEVSYNYHMNRSSFILTYYCEHCKKNMTFTNKCALHSHVNSHEKKSMNLSKMTIKSLEINDLLVKYAKQFEGSSSATVSKRIDKTKKVNQTIEQSEANESSNVSKTVKAISKTVNALPPPVEVNIEENRDFTSCPICHEIYEKHGESKSRKAITYHFQSLDDSVGSLVCKKCKRFLPNKCAMRAHEEFHTQTAPFICPECGLTLPSFPILDEHLKRTCFHYDRLMVVKCVVEGCKTICFEREIEKHFMIHTKLIFQCVRCSEIFGKKIQLIAHTKSVHKEELTSGQSVYQCQICEKMIDKDDSSHAFSHFGNALKANYLYSCLGCKNNSSKMHLYKRHIANCIPYQKKVNYFRGIDPKMIIPSKFNLANVNCFPAQLEKTVPADTNIKNVNTTVDSNNKIDKPMKDNPKTDDPMKDNPKTDNSKTNDPMIFDSEIDKSKSNDPVIFDSEIDKSKSNNSKTVNPVTVNLKKVNPNLKKFMKVVPVKIVNVFPKVDNLMTDNLKTVLANSNIKKVDANPEQLKKIVPSKINIMNVHPVTVDPKIDDLMAVEPKTDNTKKDNSKTVVPIQIKLKKVIPNQEQLKSIVPLKINIVKAIPKTVNSKADDNKTNVFPNAKNAVEIISVESVDSLKSNLSKMEFDLNEASENTDELSATESLINDDPSLEQSNKSQKRKLELWENKNRVKISKSQISDEEIILPNTTKTKKLICYKCNYSSETKELFQQHILIHRDVNSAFQCMECGVCFNIKKVFAAHLSACHNISDSELYIRCHNSEITEVQNVPIVEIDETETQDEVDSTNEVLLCEICALPFSNVPELEKHFRSHGMAFLMTKKRL